MSRPARVVINLSALRHNLARVRHLAPGRKIMAVVKADGYGHGLTRVARTLAAADGFGVACLEEAKELREAGIRQPVLLLEGPYCASEIDEIARLELDIVVHDTTQVGMLERAGIRQAIRVWLKVDSGMHRLGILPERVGDAWRRLEACRAVAPGIGLMTHLAAASEPDNPMTRTQLACFAAVCGGYAGERSIANSAAILAFPESHADWVRPGLMLYGVSPMDDSVGVDLGLKPVMTLASQLIAVKRLPAGAPVGYGATWHCPEAMPVGIVAAGYADGYPRHAPSGTPVLVNGRRAPLIGRASMDMLIADLRGLPEVHVGDPVVLWGDGLPVEAIARRAGTIPYALLCAVHKRLRFMEHGEGQDPVSMQ